MDFRLLSSFLTLVREKNFHRAADALGISQPPLSRQMRKLESELGQRLIDREARGFSLTAAGKALAEDGPALLREARILERRVALASEQGAPPVEMGHVGSIMHSFLPGLLASASASGRLPAQGLSLHEMSTEAQVAAISEARLDLGFVRGWGRSQDLEYRELGSERLAVARPMGVEGGAALRESGLPFISGSARGMKERTASALARLGWEPRARFSCDQYASLLSLVGGGLGWAILPVYERGGWARSGIELEFLDDSIPFGIAWRRGEAGAWLEGILGSVEDYFSPPEAGAPYRS